MTNNISSSGCQPQINQDDSPEVAEPQGQFSTGGLEIVHATKGRIRIRATDAIFNSKLDNIAASVRQYQGVTTVFVHQQTSSLVLMFDTGLLSLSQMLGILQEFEIQPAPVSHVDPFAVWKSPDFWVKESVSLIPLMTGLAVTGGLGISGFAGIPVYMLTADVTRRLIDYLQPQFSGLETEKAQKEAIIETPLSHNSQLVYSVVHAIPGRVRFHVPGLAEDPVYGQRLEKLLRLDPLVIHLRLNYHAASVVITYQPGEVPMAHWVSLMELALVSQPAANAGRLSTEENLSSLWAEMKFPGMSFSLDYMANFWK
jgi:hypothetical protein